MEWIMVRVPRGLHRQLRELADLWRKAAEGGRTDVRYNPDGELPLWEVVDELLRRDEAHRSRSSADNRNRRARQGTPRPSGTEDDGSRPSAS